MNKFDRVRNKASMACARLATWQPPPYLGESWSGERLSRWFYKKALPREPDSCLMMLNFLGTLWSNFWWKLAFFFGRGL